MVDAPRPAPSAEARRLIEAAIVAARTRENVDAVFALSDHVAGLEAEVARLRDALEPFVRADRAIGSEPGPFRFETANGHRLIQREHLRAAAIAAQEKPHG